MEQEVTGLQEKLLIPISKLEFESGKHVRIFSGGKYINNLPVKSVEGMIHYSTNEDNLSQLDWYTVYTDNKEEIDKQADELSVDVVDNVSPANFGYVYVHYTNGRTSYARCVFSDGKWLVS